MVVATPLDMIARREGVGELLANFAVVLKHRQTWLVALAGLGTSGPLLGFAGLWGVPFLQAAFGGGGEPPLQLSIGSTSSYAIPVVSMKAIVAG